MRDHDIQQSDAGSYVDKVWNPSDDGIAGTTGGHRAAGEFSTKALTAVAVGLGVGNGGAGVVAGRGVEQRSVRDGLWDDGHGAGCGDETEQDQRASDHEERRF